MVAPEILSRGKSVLEKLERLREQSGQILDGYTNIFMQDLGLLSEEAQAVYAYRFGECVKCPMKQGNACSKHQRHKRVDMDCYVRGCGCNLSAATKSPTKWCPMHKWPPVDSETLTDLPYPIDKKNNPCTPL